MIDSAHLIDIPSERKQPTVPAYAVHQLKQGNIKQMSKGVITYECLMMADSLDFEDAMTEMTSFAFNQLDSVASCDSRSLFDSVVRARREYALEMLFEACEYDDPEEKVSQVNIQLPAPVAEEWDGRRGLGDEIAQAVTYVEASPWSSRGDRLADIRDLISYANGDSVEDPSQFVEAVMANDSEFWKVGHLHDSLSPDIERWEREDLTTGDLSEYGTDIPQVPEKRATALQTALANMDGICKERTAVAYAERYFDDVSEETAQQYAERVDLDAVNEDAVYLDVDGLIDRLASETRKNASSADQIRAIEAMEDYELAGFDDDPRIFGGYVHSENVQSVLSDINEMRAESGVGVVLDNAEEVRVWVSEKVAEVSSGDD